MKVLMFLISIGFVLPAIGGEKEERGVFRLHEVFEQYYAKSKPTKVFGKHEMYNLGLEPYFNDEDVESARVEAGTRIVIKLKKESAKRLQRFTAEAKDKRIGIVLMNKLMDVPKITQPIENGEIVVSLPTARDAEEITKLLQAVAKAEREHEEGHDRDRDRDKE